jgi:hypothetical protein
MDLSINNTGRIEMNYEIWNNDICSYMEDLISNKLLSNIDDFDFEEKIKVLKMLEEGMTDEEIKYHADFEAIDKEFVSTVMYAQKHEKLKKVTIEFLWNVYKYPLTSMLENAKLNVSLYKDEDSESGSEFKEEKFIDDINRNRELHGLLTVSLDNVWGY